MATLQEDYYDTVHELKTWPEYYRQLNMGLKNFEIRKDDRDFQVGDYLKLMEWNPKTEKYTGKWISREITYILNGGRFGLESGYVALALRKPKFGPLTNDLKR